VKHFHLIKASPNIEPSFHGTRGKIIRGPLNMSPSICTRFACRSVATITVRLVGGATSAAGRVEVLYAVRARGVGGWEVRVRPRALCGPAWWGWSQAPGGQWAEQFSTERACKEPGRCDPTYVVF
jgi:hypothetical protein